MALGAGFLPMMRCGMTSQTCHLHPVRVGVRVMTGAAPMFALAVSDPLPKNGAEPSGPEIVAIIFFFPVSFVFFAVNAVLAIAALIRGRSAAKPLIGCALPFLLVIPFMIWSYWQSLQARVPALEEASAAGHTEVVQALLAKGADVNAKDHDGKTALMMAAWI